MLLTAKEKKAFLFVLQRENRLRLFVCVFASTCSGICHTLLISEGADRFFFAKTLVQYKNWQGVTF